MSQADSQTPPAKPVKPPSLKSRYKLPGMIGAMAVMWLDFAYIYHGLVTDDVGAVSAGMVVMLAGAAMAYHFG